MVRILEYIHLLNEIIFVREGRGKMSETHEQRHESVVETGYSLVLIISLNIHLIKNRVIKENLPRSVWGWGGSGRGGAEPRDGSGKAGSQGRGLAPCAGYCLGTHL